MFISHQTTCLFDTRHCGQGDTSPHPEHPLFPDMYLKEFCILGSMPPGRATREERLAQFAAGSQRRRNQKKGIVTSNDDNDMEHSVEERNRKWRVAEAERQRIAAEEWPSANTRSYAEVRRDAAEEWCFSYLHHLQHRWYDWVAKAEAEKTENVEMKALDVMDRICDTVEWPEPHFLDANDPLRNIVKDYRAKWSAWCRRRRSMVRSAAGIESNWPRSSERKKKREAPFPAPTAPAKKQKVETVSTGATDDATISTVEPATSTGEPVTSTVEPVGSTIEPVGSTIEPVASTVEAVDSTIEPVAVKIEPADVKVEPAPRSAREDPKEPVDDPQVSTVSSSPVVASGVLFAHDRRDKSLSDGKDSGLVALSVAIPRREPKYGLIHGPPQLPFVGFPKYAKREYRYASEAAMRRNVDDVEKQGDIRQAVDTGEYEVFYVDAQSPRPYNQAVGARYRENFGSSYAPNATAKARFGPLCCICFEGHGYLGPRHSLARLYCAQCRSDGKIPADDAGKSLVDLRRSYCKATAADGFVCGARLQAKGRNVCDKHAEK